MNAAIYTSWYDWREITGDSKTVWATELWYWHTLGNGVQAETSKDFSDFRPFGSFRSNPLLKEYGFAENVCGLTADVGTYSSINFKGFSDLENEATLL